MRSGTGIFKKVFDGLFNPLWILVFIVVCGSIVFIPCEDMRVREGRQLIYVLMFVCLIASLIKNRWVKGFILYSVGVTSLVTVFCYGRYSGLAVEVIVNIGYFALGYHVLTEYIVKKPAAFWLNCICIAALAQMELCYFQFIKADPFFSFHVGRVLCGFMDNPTLLSAFLVCSLPAFFRRRWCWGVGLIILIVLYNNNIMAILALAAVIGFYLWQVIPAKRLKILVFILMILLTANAFLYIITPHVLETDILTTLKGEAHRRFLYWPRIVNLAQNKKVSLIGFGPGLFKLIYNIKYIHLHPHNKGVLLAQAHCDILQVWLEFGYAGLVLIGGFLTGLWLMFKRYRGRLILPACGLISILVYSLGSFPFRIGPLMFLAILWAVMIERGDDAVLWY